MSGQTIKSWLVGILIVCFCHNICAQHVTKEQLLKLFYQANVAQKANDTDKAIDIYLSVLKLSPGLPDPYLKLGKLYAAKADAVSLKKACICFSNYLRLKPEASDAEALKSEISRLTALAEKGEGVRPIEIKQPEPAVVLPVTSGEIASVAVEKVQEKVASPQDTVVTIPRVMPAEQDIVASIDSRLLGRWASDELNFDGREMWIFDIYAEDNAMWMQLTDSAYMKKKDIWLANASGLKAKGMQRGDSLVFSFEIEEKKDLLPSEKEDGKTDALSTIIDDILSFDLGSLMGGNDRKRKEDSTALAMDTVALDSAAWVEPKIIHAYVFTLKFDGMKLEGRVNTRMYDAHSNGGYLSDLSHTCELFKAPDDYLGFTYVQPSDVELSSMPELCEIYNQKRRASDSDNVSSLNDLGCLSMWGVGTHRNMKMALSYFMEASMKNNLFATLNLALLYQDGYGVEKDLNKARDLFMRAYESGYTDALVLCGDSYWESEDGMTPDYSKALACYQKAMLRRCPYAAFRLGWLYNEGLGVEQDTVKALNYYKQAVSMSYPDALADMGSFYRKGILVERDYKKAMEYLQKAAAKENVKAMYEIYQMFLRGEGVQPDFKLAKEWLRRSMDADNSILKGYSSIKKQIKSIIHAKK